MKSKHSKRTLSVVMFCLLSVTLLSQDRVKPGVEVLRDRGFDILKGKRVGLITNPTGITSDFQSTIDVLFHAQEVTLVTLYGPEHGVRGDMDAGSYVEHHIDTRTGLMAYSLYGKNRKPSKEMLAEIDVLVYDIQDIGVRAYTYISTLGLAMEAAAENNIPFVVLDRPNPLTGDRVEGPVLDLKFKSFVGAYPIPYLYGMTVGELARMINGEGWLNTGGKKCDLTVVPLEGWKRSMWMDDTGLPWVMTSAHVPHTITTIYEMLTGTLGELGSVNNGVGYTTPFELVGAPWINGPVFAEYLNQLQLPGVYFRAMSFIPYYHDTTHLRHNGVQIHITDRERLRMTETQISLMAALIRLYPAWNIFDLTSADRNTMFDKVNGTSEVREMLQKQIPVKEIMSKFEKQGGEFKPIRLKYLLYH